MPSPKDIKKILNTAQGTKAAGKAMDLEELLGTLPKGTKAQQLEAELMFKRLAEEQAARYAGHTPPTEQGNAALAEAKKTLAPTEAKQAPNKKKQFIENVYSKYSEHPFNSNQRVISEGAGDEQKFAQFELKPGFGKDEVEIDWISAYPQRSGMGTKAIKALQQEAQDAGITLTLFPWDKGNVSQRALTKFYKGLGFQPAGGRSRSLMWKPEAAVKAPEVNTTQAPAVIIPSKISNVERAVRESRGEFGAKRVQRTADQIKNLDDQYTEEALRRAFAGDNTNLLMIGNPAEFKNFAAELTAPYRPGIEKYLWEMSNKNTRPSEIPLEARRQGNVVWEGGATDVPFLELNQKEGKLPFVSGHEGRHRNLAMEELGYPSTLWRMMPRAALREDFPRRDPEEYLNALIEHLGTREPLVVPEGKDWADAINLPELFADGGGVHMAGGGKALKVLKGAGKAADATQDVQSIVSAGKPLTAAERAMVGRLAAEYTANQPVIRLSEALGNVGAEGKNLRVTQTDRTGAKYLGGAPFSMMQKVDPRYAESKATWGVKTRGAATNIINQSDPDVIWSTLIGSKTQHRSNELIFDKLYKAFQKSAKEGNLSPELRTKFNAALEPIFGEGADILDPKLRKEIDTFEKRAIVGNLLLGKDIGGATRGGSIIPGLKIMSETTEPMLKGVETFSIGPRLFTLDQGVITRPDLHPAFPEILQGEDLNQLFVPVPNRIALPTFNEDFRARTGRKKPGYYELTNTPEGDPYPTQFVDEDYLNFLQKEGYAHGGPVHMAGGNEPGESIGEMFKPKPLTIPSPLTDMADAIRRQFSKEKRSMNKPGAATDILLRGPVAFAAGTPMDLVEMAGQGIDYLQTKIPSLRKKASVMDTGPEKTPPMGYAPKVQVSPDGTMPYGTEDFQNKLRQSGLTTDEERPLLELGAGIFAPFAASKALKYGKALAPTAADIMETQLLRATEPMRMNIVPDGGPSGKLKAPANDIGFYNPAEKAALNLQRKKGTGATFVSDLKKQPGVNDERLAELGLGDLASRPNVTKEELIAAADQNRIPLREVVSRERDAAAIDKLEEEYESLAQQFEAVSGQGNPEEVMRISAAVDKNLAEQNRIKSLPEARFGPATSPDYSLPGGQNYREIRVGLPAKEKPQYFIAYKDGSTMGTGFASRADAEAELADLFGSRPDLEIRQGVDGRSMTAKTEDNFFHSTHHGNEPNVLFHLRVADHVDSEGKKGLLIDELQSDWHQQGRTKGYRGNAEKDYNNYFESLGERFIAEQKQQNIKAGMTPTDAEYYATEMYSSLAQREGHRGIARAMGEEDKMVELSNQYKRDINAVPDAPFKENWYQLGIKRAIKEAADTGMDRVYLTTGARQADRYDLSKRVSYIDYRKSSVYNKYELGIADIDGDPINLPKERYSAEELPDIVGKEVADKIIKGEGESGGGRKTLRGLDLKIGGEGMKQYYDKTYKNFLDKYAKQFGARVGETKIPTDLAGNQWPNFRDWMEANYPDLVSRSMPYWYAGTSNAYVRAFQSTLSKKYEPVYYIDITPKMRESTKKGQSYKDGGAVAMAAGGAVDYESRFNQMLQDHVAGMAQGGAVDYESRFNDMLQKHVQGMAEGGAVNEYNADPDMADGGRFIQAPAFAEGGAVKSIWTVN